MGQQLLDAVGNVLRGPGPGCRGGRRGHRRQAPGIVDVARKGRHHMLGGQPGLPQQQRAAALGECACHSALETAVLTAPEAISDEARLRLALLLERRERGQGS